MKRHLTNWTSSTLITSKRAKFNFCYLVFSCYHFVNCTYFLSIKEKKLQNFSRFNFSDFQPLECGVDIGFSPETFWPEPKMKPWLRWNFASSVWYPPLFCYDLQDYFLFIRPPNYFSRRKVSDITSTRNTSRVRIVSKKSVIRAYQRKNNHERSDYFLGDCYRYLIENQQLICYVIGDFYSGFFGRTFSELTPVFRRSATLPVTLVHCPAKCAQRWRLTDSFLKDEGPICGITGYLREIRALLQKIIPRIHLYEMSCESIFEA